MAIFAVNLVDMIFLAMLGNAALAAAVGYAGTVMFFTNPSISACRSLRAHPVARDRVKGGQSPPSARTRQAAPGMNAARARSPA